MVLLDDVVRCCCFFRSVHFVFVCRLRAFLFLRSVNDSVVLRCGAFFVVEKCTLCSHLTISCICFLLRSLNYYLNWRFRACVFMRSVNYSLMWRFRAVFLLRDVNEFISLRVPAFFFIIYHICVCTRIYTPSNNSFNFRIIPSWSRSFQI